MCVVLSRNEFWGQEGMVKIKNHEDSVLNVDETYLPAIDGNSSSQGGDSDSKRLFIFFICITCVIVLHTRLCFAAVLI